MLQDSEVEILIDTDRADFHKEFRKGIHKGIHKEFRKGNLNEPIAVSSSLGWMLICSCNAEVQKQRFPIQKTVIALS